MPASNRKRYSDDFGGGSSAVRTLGAFLLCAVLSFALGFFVLARFWSSKPKSDGDTPGKGLVASAIEGSSNRHGDDTPVPQHTSLPPVPPAPHATPPSIDPEEAVQKPSSVEEHADAQKPSSGDDGNDSSDDSGDDSKKDAAKQDETKSRKDDKTDDTNAKKPDEVQKPSEGTSSDPAAQTGDVRPKRRKRIVITENAPAAKSPDDESTPPESTDDVNDVHVNRRKRAPRTEAPVTGGLYRVQIGAYSTREAAEEQVRAAADKGLQARIYTTVNGSHTLYHVQHSAHRTRVGAEAEKQRLVDAGLDAYISNPEK